MNLQRSNPVFAFSTSTLTPLALACAATFGGFAARANPPDWSKATAPATMPVQPTAPLSPAATTVPQAGSAFAPKPTIAPAVNAIPVAVPATPSTSALAPKPVVKANGATGARDLFTVEDRAIIIVGGKPVAAGELKAKLKADLAAKAGAPRLLKATPRTLDPVALNVLGGPAPAGMGGKAGITAHASNQTVAALGSAKPGLSKTSVLINNGAGDAYARSQCLDKGPPKIDEVAGKLRAGSKVTIWGTCFGDKPGRVEVIGQFAGGKLVPAFTAWDKTSITIEVPATIRGASDHAVAVSIVTSDNKMSSAMQAQFVAARERVEVPDRMWAANGGGYELAATTETLNTANNHMATNPAAGGRLPKSVRINPQCALDSMEVTTLAGAVTAINGFDVGPPNEASVTMDWVGTCVDTKTTTHYNYVIAQVGDDISISSACRVALQARTWAYCPAGVAP